MTPRQAAKKWGCSVSTVTSRCREGMIPFAEKNSKGWNIPDDIEKLPCTRQFAINLLEDAIGLQNGIDVEIFNEKNKENTMDSYRYLSNNGFISKLKFENEDECIIALKGSTITHRGKKLLDNDNLTIKEIDAEAEIKGIKSSAKVRMKLGRKNQLAN